MVALVKMSNPTFETMALIPPAPNFEEGVTLRHLDLSDLYHAGVSRHLYLLMLFRQFKELHHLKGGLYVCVCVAVCVCVRERVGRLNWLSHTMIRGPHLQSSSPTKALSSLFPGIIFCKPLLTMHHRSWHTTQTLHRSTCSVSSFSFFLFFFSFLSSSISLCFFPSGDDECLHQRVLIVL